MTYDPARRRIVLLRINDATEPETWEFDGERWRRQQPVTSPRAAFLQRLVYSPTRRATTLITGTLDFFAGTDVPASRNLEVMPPNAASSSGNDDDGAGLAGCGS
ncbi:MAG: hypothetical protein R2939_12620 [Kofleriaceae bacterium]